jgi:hypothetical protein
MSSSRKIAHFDASGSVSVADLEAAIFSNAFITTDGPASKRSKVEDDAVPATPPRPAKAKKACPRKPARPAVKPYVFTPKVSTLVNPVWSDEGADDFVSTLPEPPAKRMCFGLSTVPEADEGQSAFASAVWNAFYAPKTTSASNA